MKLTYILGIDTAKYKIRAALRGTEEERFLFEKDLPASASGLRELLTTVEEQVPAPKTADPDRSDWRAPSQLEWGAEQSGLRHGFGPTTAGKVLAYLPSELLRWGNNRQVSARLQAFMGNDPRLKESGQWKGQTKMSKRGVEILRTAFFQAAFSAAQHDPELRSFYRRKRTQGKCHQVALSHLMRILTRRLVAVLRSQQPYRPKEVAPLSYAA